MQLKTFSIFITLFKGQLTEFGDNANVDNHDKKTLSSLFMDGVQLPQGYSHFEEAAYFLPLSSQKFLVLILPTSE